MVRKSIVYVSLMYVLAGCYKEIALPVTASFEYQVSNNFAVPATVVLNNTTAGGETFSWTFEGAEPATSTKKTPGEIVYKNPGTYTIRLEARNFDGMQSVVEKKITIDTKLAAAFSFSIVGNSYAPATLNFSNTSVGFDKLEWFFDGGSPATSDQANPVVTFENGGSHKVSLKISNSHASVVKDTLITLEPELIPDFDIIIPPQYEELEAPVTVTMKNKSIGSTSSLWMMDGADIPQSQQNEPSVRFSKAGVYTISLDVSNGKKSKKINKSITVKSSKGYAYIKDVELGIFSARKTIAIYYSTLLRKAFTESGPITASEASTVDLLFFGLDEAFTYNRFLSPDEATSVGLMPISGVSTTTILNPSQVTTVVDFDNLDEAQLKALSIGQPTVDQDTFFSESSPKLILFENAQKKKGVILIKEFIRDGANSRIRFDIKVLN